MCHLTNIISCTQLAERTIDLALRNVKRGGLPFSAIIISEQGHVIGEGVNQVDALADCTAHAEIQAIRDAYQRVGSSPLKKATLYASGEPCGLCYMAILMAGIKELVILTDRFEAKHFGFDYMWTYEFLVQPRSPVLSIKRIAPERRFAPFEFRRTNA